MAKDKVGFTKIVLIGGSAGGLDVLLQILPALKPVLLFPIVIVLHRKTSQDSPLVEVLAGKTKLPVKEIEEKERILPGIIYVVPADYHLLFEQDTTFSLDASEKVNYSRPSIDVVFESAAEVYQQAVTGILLSGANADGTKGFESIQSYKGITIAQEPGTAEISYMPQQAIKLNVVDEVLDIAGIITYINSL